MRIEVIGVLAAVAWAQSSSLRAQETAFRYQPEKVAVGSVYRYEKSNIDGTHASLNFSFPHWTEPEGSFTFGIADVVFKDGGPVFAYKGDVKVQYLRDEEREGVACRKYRIDGAGLENRGGVVWTDRARGHIVDCEIDLPDEPGYTSGKLRLVGIEKMNPEAWQSFMASRLNPSK